MKTLMLPFHQYQDQAIDFVLDRQGANIFARPGKGKTRIALETIEATNKRTLIVAPLFPALTVWRQEADKWGYNFNMRVLHGKEKKQGTEDVSVINYDGLEWLRNQKFLKSYDYIIYDEVSKMKAPGTNRFRRWRKHMPTFDYRLGLTGTPMGNRLIDLWGEMFVVDLGAVLGHAKYKFEDKFFVLDRHVKNLWHPQDDAQERIFELIKPNAMALDYMIDEMPGLHHNSINLELPKAARLAYEEMKKSMMIGDTEIMAVNAGVKSAKLRQIAAGSVYDTEGDVINLHKAKQTALRDLVDELQGDPLLLFFEFRHDLTAIKKVVGDKVPVLNGDTKPENMAKIVEKWNRGEITVLACHPKTAGMGGNMQESGHNVCFYTLPWSLEDVEQPIDRVWRQGQKRDVIVHYLICMDTKDEDVFEAIQNKQEDQDALFAHLK